MVKFNSRCKSLIRFINPYWYYSHAMYMGVVHSIVSMILGSNIIVTKRKLFICHLCISMSVIYIYIILCPVVKYRQKTPDPATNQVAGKHEVWNELPWSIHDSLKINIFLLMYRSILINFFNINFKTVTFFSLKLLVKIWVGFLCSS